MSVFTISDLKRILDDMVHDDHHVPNWLIAKVTANVDIEERRDAIKLLIRECLENDWRGLLIEVLATLKKMSASGQSVLLPCDLEPLLTSNSAHVRLEVLAFL